MISTFWNKFKVLIWLHIFPLRYVGTFFNSFGLCYVVVVCKESNKDIKGPIYIWDNEQLYEYQYIGEGNKINQLTIWTEFLESVIVMPYFFSNWVVSDPFHLFACGWHDFLIAYYWEIDCVMKNYYW